MALKLRGPCFLGSWDVSKNWLPNLTQLAWTGQELLKKMTAKYDNIFSTYIWTFLSWPQVIFFQILFCHQRAQQSFFSKSEFWAENFFRHSFYDKNWHQGSMNPFFAKKWVKMAKIFVNSAEACDEQVLKISGHSWLELVRNC